LASLFCNLIHQLLLWSLVTSVLFVIKIIQNILYNLFFIWLSSSWVTISLQRHIYIHLHSLPLVHSLPSLIYWLSSLLTLKLRPKHSFILILFPLNLIQSLKVPPWCIVKLVLRIRLPVKSSIIISIKVHPPRIIAIINKTHLESTSWYTFTFLFIFILPELAIGSGGRWKWPSSIAKSCSSRSIWILTYIGLLSLLLFLVLLALYLTVLLHNKRIVWLLIFIFLISIIRFFFFALIFLNHFHLLKSLVY